MRTRQQLGSKLTRLQSMSEQELRQIVLVPLLRGLGLRDVIEYHGGASEKGKDLVGYYISPMGDRRYVALVVKRGDIHGSVSRRGSASEVLYQTQQALNEPYVDIYGLKELLIDEVWIVCSGVIKNTAIESIRETLNRSNLSRLLRLIDGRLLVQMIDQHLPAMWQTNEPSIAILFERQADEIRVLAHQILAPLMVVIAALGHSWSLSSRSEEAKEFAIAVLENLVTYTHGLLTAFAIATGGTPAFSLGILDLLKECQHLAQHCEIGLGRSDVSVVFESLGSVAWKTDIDHFRAMAYPLLHNAFVYSEADSVVHISICASETVAEVRITSVGEPIATEETDSLFTQFYRGEKVRRSGRYYRGLGLGLWVSRELARSIGGNVILRLDPDRPRTSEFVLAMPAR